MDKKIINGNKYTKVNSKGQHYLSIPGHVFEKPNDLFVKKVKFIGLIKNKEVEIDMTIEQFNEWLDKRFSLCEKDGVKNG